MNTKRKGEGNKTGRRKIFAKPKRGRGGIPPTPPFRHARAFRRSQAEAVSSSQRNFAQGLEYHRQLKNTAGFSAVFLIPIFSLLP